MLGIAGLGPALLDHLVLLSLRTQGLGVRVEREQAGVIAGGALRHLDDIRVHLPGSVRVEEGRLGRRSSGSSSLFPRLRQDASFRRGCLRLVGSGLQVLVEGRDELVSGRAGLDAGRQAGPVGLQRRANTGKTFRSPDCKSVSSAAGLLFVFLLGQMPCRLVLARRREVFKSKLPGIFVPRAPMNWYLPAADEFYCAFGPVRICTSLRG